MGDVYVEAGAVKGSVPVKYVTSAQAGMKTAITAAVRKPGSGMTAVKPVGGKWIQVNVLVTKLVQEGSFTKCVLIGELYELPARQRFSPGGSVRGEGKVMGKIDAVVGECVKAAVADLMTKIGPAIAGSQAAPASTGTVGSKSPLIYIAPYVIHAKNAPATLVAKTKADLSSMMDRRFKANTKRFTLDSKAFKVGSQMPAYVIEIDVDSVTYNASAKELVAKTKGQISEHPSGSIRVTSLSNQAKMQGLNRPPRDDEKVRLIVDSAEAVTDAAIKWLLQTHP